MYLTVTCVLLNLVFFIVLNLKQPLASVKPDNQLLFKHLLLMGFKQTNF